MPGRSWFLLSALGRDRSGIVADLAPLGGDSQGNLEGSRMALLGAALGIDVILEAI